ncbi:hypothetical protein AN389_01837 [Pseudoalteromonas sp. P1-7a]|nr:hypothetical protein AN389_01837 [Pseudoalteromonas sp. P1-7a]
MIKGVTISYHHDASKETIMDELDLSYEDNSIK